MNYNLMWMVMFFIISGLFMFSIFQKHLLLMLLSLEYIMLNVFLVIVMNSSFDLCESFIMLIFLVFAVSEGGLGLSLLVSTARNHGSDCMKSFNLLW